MAISWLGKTAAVRQFVAAVQASATAVIDASEGSVILAIGQAATGAYLWLQALIAQVLLLTRAATSFGADLDSFFADFFFYRLQAVASTGTETFSRFTPTQQAVVPVGQVVSTGPGGVSFIVTTDTTNAAYSAALGGYVLAPSTASVTVPIAAVNAGAVGNVLANTITSFASPIPGIDTCTNGSDLVSGADAESDPSFRARFQLYMQSLREGTVAAIRLAVLSTRQGLTCNVLENLTPMLAADNGFLTILVDDGTGNPSDAIIANASLAVDAVRAAGIRYGVIKPTIQTNTIACTVVSKISGQHAADVTAATAALTKYVNTLPDGTALVWARLYQVAFDSSANITDVTGLLLNGGTYDVATDAVHVNKTSSVTVS